MGQIVEVVVDKNEPALPAATILAAIAYPLPTEKVLIKKKNLIRKKLIAEELNKRNQFWQSVRALALYQRAEKDPDWAQSSQMVRPFLLFPDFTYVAKTVDKGWDIIKTKRFPAGKMLGSLLARDAFKKFDPKIVADAFNKNLGIEHDANRPDKIILKSVAINSEVNPKTGKVEKIAKPASVRTMAQEVADHLNNAPEGWSRGNARKLTRESVIQRIWSPTKPVVHMALILDGIMCERSIDATGYIEDLLVGDWISSAIAQGNMLRQELTSHDNPPIQIDEDELIQFQLVPIDGG